MPDEEITLQLLNKYFKLGSKALDIVNANMAEVVFKFDREKDLFNIWETCNKNSSWYDHKKNVSPIFLEICGGKEFSECREELKDYRLKMYNSGLVEIFVETLQEA